MKNKTFYRALSSIMILFTLLSMIASLPALAEEEIVWRTIYSGGQTHSNHGGENEVFTDLYSGETIAIEKGYRFQITWEGKWYDMGIQGGKLVLEDSNGNKETLFSRKTDNFKVYANETSFYTYTDTSENPEKFKFVMLFDFSTDTHEAKIDVYDTDSTTLLGTIIVDIRNIEDFKAIYYECNPYNLTFSRIYSTSKFAIEQDAKDLAGEQDVEWENLIDKETISGTWRNERKENKEAFFDLYDIDLGGSDNEKYRIRLNVEFYKGGGVNRGEFRITDGTNEVAIFSKEKDKSFFSGDIQFAINSQLSPHPVTIDMLLDFSTKIATVTFYDDAKATKLLGTKGVSIKELSGIKSFYYYVQEYNIYSYPQSLKMTIDKGMAKPVMRRVAAYTDFGEKIELYGEKSLDLSLIKVSPFIKKINFDMNSDIDLADASSKIRLVKENTDTNLLSGLTSKNGFVVASLAGDLEENAKYSIIVEGGIKNNSLINTFALGTSYRIDFNTGIKNMNATITNSRITGSSTKRYRLNAEFTNKSAEPKPWSVILSCYDVNGALLWSGMYSGTTPANAVDDYNSVTINLPDGALPPGTVTAKAYIWDNPMANEIYSSVIDVAVTP